MEQYFTSSPEQTEAVGASLASALLARGETRVFLALCGEMGVGKTAFTRGFVSALCKAPVRSPTYTVVNEYRGGVLPIFHFDLYRLQDEEDLISIGYYDYLDRDGFCLCEWSEKIPECLPERYLQVTLLRRGFGDEREIRVEEM